MYLLDLHYMQIAINVGGKNTMYNEAEQLMVYIEFTSKYP